MDEGESLTSRFLQTRIMQLLGRISLSLYLSHWVIMKYIILAMNREMNYTTSVEYYNAIASGEINTSYFSPLVMIIISPIFAFLLNKYVEEPITNTLKGTDK